MFHIKPCINIEHRLLISSYQLKTKFVRGGGGRKRNILLLPTHSADKRKQKYHQYEVSARKHISSV